MPITCLKCGKELPDDAQFCGECGTVVAREKKPDYCSNCFAELPEGVKFCLQCGNPAVAAQDVPDQVRNKAIYEELRSIAPTQIRYRRDRAEYEATGQWPDRYTDEEIEDFEANRAILAIRAREWAEYETSGMESIHWFLEALFPFINTSGAFSQESQWFPTNKPNKHRALFYKTFADFSLFQLRQQFVLSYDDPPKPTPLFLEYLRKVWGYTEEVIRDYLQDYTFELRGMCDIEEWETKDDALFPPPQPIEAEAAGAILNFTTDEAVLIVYTDCSYAGKTVELSIELHALNKGLKRNGVDVAQIIERTAGDTKICAAIFKHIPFVTNEARNKEQALQETDAKVEGYYLASNLEEKITLFRSNVNQLDWRGRK